jgi:16S rRNA (adenine(1408)-N(1))-methyltransferase
VDEPTDNSTATPFLNSSRLTGGGIVIDLGTGDGTFVYQSARQNPQKFYLGIDANPRPLEKISEKIHRKPAKGGLPNVLFLQHAVEALPKELDGVADEVHVHFPWGSLLRAVALGDASILGNLRRICAANALLEVIVGSDPERDRAELERLGVPPVTVEHVDAVLAGRYRAAGFEIIERGRLAPSEWPRLHTAWAKKLQLGTNRSLVYWIARVLEQNAC